MNPSSNLIRASTVVGFFMILFVRHTKADGGLILSHQVQDPFSVTVFVPPETVRSRPIDVSVLVQWQENGEPILNADVGLTLNPLSGSVTDRSDPVCRLPSAARSFPSSNARDHWVTARATREQASNKLLYAAPVELNSAGIWRLHVSVSCGSVNAGFDCLLPVGETSGGSSGLWPFLAFPPFAIVAFGMNQWLRRNSLEKA
jgi:hypothetical protein